MKKLICSTFREGYGIDQIRRTMTAGELINFLAQYDEDTPVYLSFDNGYTYGGITEGRFEEDYGEEDYSSSVSRTHPCAPCLWRGTSGRSSSAALYCTVTVERSL